MFVHTVIMVIEPHMKQGRQHKLISTIFLATSVTKKLDHNTAICACNEPKFELARNLGEYRDSEPARARFWEDKHMRKNLTEIVFILDRSGSMSGLERVTIGGAIP